jgi:hypothetical protein
MMREIEREKEAMQACTMRIEANAALGIENVRGRADTKGATVYFQEKRKRSH